MPSRVAELEAMVGAVTEPGGLQAEVTVKVAVVDTSAMAVPAGLKAVIVIT